MHTSTCIYLHTHILQPYTIYIFIYLYVLHHRQRRRSRILPYPSVCPVAPRCFMLRYVFRWPCYVTFTNISLAYPPSPPLSPCPLPSSICQLPRHFQRVRAYFFLTTSTIFLPSLPADKSYVAHGHEGKGGGEVRLRHTHTPPFNPRL